MLKAMLITPETAQEAALALDVRSISQYHQLNNKTWLMIDEDATDSPFAWMIPHAVFREEYTVITPHEDFYEVSRIYN